MIMEAYWSALKYRFYLVTVDAAKIEVNFHFYGGMMFIVELWLASSQSNTVGIFGQLIVVDVDMGFWRFNL